jgi:chromosome segregation ATPase
MRPVSESSIFSSETQEPPPTTKLLRFDLPAPQTKGRPDKHMSRRASPEKFSTRGPYASESDNESMWNSSDTSTTTQATSVLSKDDSASYSDTPAHIRPTFITEQHSEVSAGPSRRHTEYTDNYVRDQGQVMQVNVRPKQQQPLGPKSAMTSRQPPMITQASASGSEHGANQALAPYVQVISNHGTDNSVTMAELYSLRNEVTTLREKESRATADLASVQHRLDQLQKEKDELKSEESKLQQEVDDLEEDHEKQSRQLDKTKDRADGLKKAMDKLEKDNDQKLERAKKDRALAIQKIHKDRDQIQERLEKEHAEALKTLGSERDQLTATVSTLEAKLQDTERYLKRHKELNETLERKCLALEKETAQHTDYKSMFAAKSVNLERELSDKAAIKRAQDSSYVARIATLEISLEARELRVKNLEDDLAKSTTEATGLTSERDKLKIDLHEQLSKVETLREEVAALEKAKAEAHQQTISLDDTRLKELGSKDAIIATIEAENGTLKAQHETTTKEKEELEIAKKASQEQAESLGSELEQLKKDTQESTSRIAQLEEECTTLRGENTTLQETSTAEAEAAAASASRAEELQGQNATLETRATELQDKSAALEKQLKEVRRTLAGAENEAQRLAQQIVDMQKRGRPKPKRNPKKAEKILAVRCPREETNDV